MKKFITVTSCTQLGAGLERMTKKLLAILLLAIVLFQSTIFTQAKEYAETTPSGIAYDKLPEEVDQYIKTYEKGLASVAVAVYDGDETVFSKCYGFSDIENGILADETTVYEWGSISKLFVWVSVMQLWEQGKIDFETDIREYLPEGFLTKLQYEEEKITMENLMSHNAGWQESFYEDQMAKREDLDESLEKALVRCEPYQAYHVGEYTAYSNWGTALAAFVVECISGEDYVDYVHKHILEPLKMEETCLAADREDNLWVKEKREELKCYYRGAEETYNEDYGICNSWVQLYPAGAVLGTLKDFTTFAKAFVAEDSPLFEKKETREIMFLATSYYGDSDIAKNCHGLWTSEYAVQTLGHAGNTMGCSANLVFEPESGLGVVILTNEPGESMFNYGIPAMIFGDIRNSERLKDEGDFKESDISGVYTSKRMLPEGAGKSMSYMGGIMPWKSVEDGQYKMTIGEATLTKIADKQYIMEDNGMKMFMYESTDSKGNTRLEMMSADYVKEQGFFWRATGLIAFFVIGLISIVLLMIKGLKKVFRKGRAYTKAEKYILFQQVIYANSVIVLAGLNTGVFGIKNSFGFAMFSGIMAGVLAVISIVNSVGMRGTNEKDGKYVCVKKLLWSVLGVYYCLFVMEFELFRFWSL